MKKFQINTIIFILLCVLCIYEIPVIGQTLNGINNNHQENDVVKVLGQIDDKVVNNYVTASTNAKLNALKNSFEGMQNSVDYLIKNCFSNLTLWVDSVNSFYGKNYIILNRSDGSTVAKKLMVLDNNHYQVTFPRLSDGEYTINYVYDLDGKTLDMSSKVVINGQDVVRKLSCTLQNMKVEDIQKVCKLGKIREVASVGDTFSDDEGKYTYTIIGIDQDIPCDDQEKELDKTQYGNVLTVMCLGAQTGPGNGSPVSPNIENTPWGNQKAIMDTKSEYTCSDYMGSEMRKKTLPEYSSRLPLCIQNVIGQVRKTTGVMVSYNLYNAFKSKEKCFLLGVREVFGEAATGGGNVIDKEYEETFQYQYFESIATTEESRDLNQDYWYLRSGSTLYDNYLGVWNGRQSGTTCDNKRGGVIPAFCIY